MIAAPDKAQEALVRVVSLAGLPVSVQRSVVDKVVTDPHIAKRVSTDLRAPGFISHPNATYYAAYIDGEMVGVYLVIRVSAVEVDLHAYLTQAATTKSRDLAKAIFECIFDDERVARITAQIVEGLESVRNHCLKVGFKYEGFRRDACIKDGCLVGVHILGMTRLDWKDA